MPTSVRPSRWTTLAAYVGMGAIGALVIALACMLVLFASTITGAMIMGVWWLCSMEATTGVELTWSTAIFAGFVVSVLTSIFSRSGKG